MSGNVYTTSFESWDHRNWCMYVDHPQAVRIAVPDHGQESRLVNMHLTMINNSIGKAEHFLVALGAGSVCARFGSLPVEPCYHFLGVIGSSCGSLFMISLISWKGSGNAAVPGVLEQLPANLQ